MNSALPIGCTCAPSQWEDPQNIPAVCTTFEPHEKFTDMCKNCEHDEGCHGGVKCGPTGIEAEVCNDIAARQIKGLAKYGATVANNPLELKAWIQHAYEECLDQAVYLKRAMREMDNDQAQAGGA